MTRHQFVEATPTNWTACVVPHTHDPDRQRTATRGLLCAGHYRGLEQDLTEFPALATETEHALVHFGNGLSPKVSGSKEQPLPYPVDSKGNSRPSDALRLSRDLLASWCRQVLDDHPSGLHTPALNLTALSAFLLRHLDWIAQQLWIDDLHRELRDTRHALRSSLTTARTRVVPLGVCGLPLSCDVATHVETCCEGTLRAFVPVIDEGTDPRPIVCSSCGTEHQPEAWRGLSRRLRKDEDAWLTAAQLSELLRVPIGTVWRWAHEDEWRRVDRRPRRYHHDDAQKSYDSRRLEATA